MKANDLIINDGRLHKFFVSFANVESSLALTPSRKDVCLESVDLL